MTELKHALPNYCTERSPSHRHHRLRGIAFASSSSLDTIVAKRMHCTAARTISRNGEIVAMEGGTPQSWLLWLRSCKSHLILGMAHSRSSNAIGKASHVKPCNSCLWTRWRSIFRERRIMIDLEFDNITASALSNGKGQAHSERAHQD